jgi:hypothetical protein
MMWAEFDNRFSRISCLRPRALSLLRQQKATFDSVLSRMSSPLSPASEREMAEKK